MEAAGFWQFDVGDLFTAAIGGLGLFGLYFAYKELRMGQRAHQTQLVTQLYQEFSRDADRMEFIYRLDYAGSRGWKFDAASFPYSKDEAHLDSLLYFLAFVGNLARQKDVSRSDLEWLVSRCRIVLRNSEVHKYLRWLRDQLPHHTSFGDAIYLYAYLVGRDASFSAMISAYGDIPSTRQAADQRTGGA